MPGSPPGGRVNAFWCRVPSRPNFGDALTPWLIRRITGRLPAFVPPHDPRPKYVVTGSVIAYANEADTVWGAGVISGSDDVCPRSTILAVRGPLTRARALRCGAACPEVYGDPALLLPRFYRPPSAPTGQVGVVGHFADLPRLAATFPNTEELRLIDIQGGIEQVIDAVTSCDVVASSSLHGIIVSHAYGVPAAWVKFKDLPSGDDTKFRDYFLSVGSRCRGPVSLGYDQLEPRRLHDVAVPPGALDLGPLVQACPLGRVP